MTHISVSRFNREKKNNNNNNNNNNGSIKQGEKSHVEQHHISYNNLFHNPHCLYSRSSRLHVEQAKVGGKMASHYGYICTYLKRPKTAMQPARLERKISSSSK